ncbi:hypothetical protein GCM10022198_20440 [Klugiella xanthotipulae]|uniref:hypothetical protein n=1 Tax=Klugiella xanthotipulae TaxID=244735 RepID=UPI001FE75893|nr:hypothetical protein [Klugiella xanthotipulae]
MKVIAPLTSARAQDEQQHPEHDTLEHEPAPHPIESYRPLLDSIGVTPSGELLALPDNTEVMVAGIRVTAQTLPSHSSKRALRVALDDGSGCAEITLLGQAQKSSDSLHFGTRLMVVAGTTHRSKETGLSVRATKVWDLAQLWSGFTTQRGA